MNRAIILCTFLLTAQYSYGQSAADYVAYRNNLDGAGGAATGTSGQVSGGGVAILPTFDVDLLRTPGGVPILSGAGNWQWEVQIVPDPFSSLIAVEAGFQLNELTGITPGDTASIRDSSNPGTAVGGLVSAFDYSGADADGFQSDLATDEAYISVGSSIFPANSDPVRLVLIEAGPATSPSTLEVLGAYGLDGISTPGTNAIVAQETSVGVITTNAFSGVFEVGAIPEPASGLLLLLAAPAAFARRRRVAL